MNKVSNEVYTTDEQFPSVGTQEINFLEKEVSNSEKGRVRLCVHKSNEDRMHEMFISFTGDNYVRPSKHLGKDESLHVLKGEADYVFFDASGGVTDVVPLGVYESERQFYCRIPENTEHALVIRSDEISIHETTPGPFNRADTVFSAWSPEDGNKAAVDSFIAEMKRSQISERAPLAMNRTGEEVFYAADKIVSVGKKEIDILKKTVSETARKRIRLCAHKKDDDLLHEMFVVYMDMTYVKPNLHVNKDESLHILEGEADFIFFDDAGNIVSIVPLGDKNSGRQFYIRVPAFVYHTIVMKSERLVIHEATPGPFNRADTLWAPWGADEKDLPAVDAFMNKLRNAIAGQ